MTRRAYNLLIKERLARGGRNPVVAKPGALPTYARDIEVEALGRRSVGKVNKDTRQRPRTAVLSQRRKT